MAPRPCLALKDSKKGETKCLSEKRNKTRGIYFAPTLLQGFKKRRKRNGSSEQTNQNKKDFISPLPCPQGFKKGGNKTAVHNLSLHQKDKTRRGNKKNISPILLTLREGSRRRNCNRSSLPEAERPQWLAKNTNPAVIVTRFSDLDRKRLKSAPKNAPRLAFPSARAREGGFVERAQVSASEVRMLLRGSWLLHRRPESTTPRAPFATHQAPSSPHIQYVPTT